MRYKQSKYILLVYETIGKVFKLTHRAQLRAKPIYQPLQNNLEINSKLRK